MYVCVCLAITEKDIGEAISNGCRSVKELREHLGVGSGCGRCTSCAHEMVRDAGCGAQFAQNHRNLSIA